MTEQEDQGHQKISVFVEKSWMIGFVVALLVQVFGGIWWAASTSTTLSSIEIRLTSVEHQLGTGMADQMIRADKMARLEERGIGMSGDIKDINAHLAVIESYLNTLARTPTPNINTKK